MAEVNPFDPPDPDANWAPGIEDRRRKDLSAWGPGRYLDPTPFTTPVVGNKLPPQSWLLRDIAPLDPRVTGSALSQSLGTKEQIQQANMDDLYRMMQERRQAKMQPQLKQKVSVP